MATKVFCDCCGKEKTGEFAMNGFAYKCHLDDLAEGKYSNGHVDREFNHISGRPIQVDLCNKCYNDVVIVAVKKLKELQKGYNNGN